MGDQGYFSKIPLCRLIPAGLSISSELLILAQQRGEVYFLFSGRCGEGREFFLYLLTVHRFQFKMILISKGMCGDVIS